MTVWRSANQLLISDGNSLTGKRKTVSSQNATHENDSMFADARCGNLSKGWTPCERCQLVLSLGFRMFNNNSMRYLVRDEKDT